MRIRLDIKCILRVYLFKIRNGISGVLDVESGNAVGPEENGHDDDNSDKDRDVGDSQTSQ